MKRKESKPLTVHFVRSVTESGRHYDATIRGLFLNVKQSGSKSWVQRVMIAGKRRDVGLGSYPAVSLAAARKKALANLAAIAEGRDPLAEKKAARQAKVVTPTFAEAAKTVHDARLPTWRNKKHGKQFMATLVTYAFPVIGDMPIDRIGREHVLRALVPIWTTKPETARRVRQRIRTVFAWAQAHVFIEHNPAGEMIDGALPPMPKVKAHHPALPYGDVADALAVIEESGAWPMTKACFRFAVLTAARSGEAREAEWSDIDIEKATWTISEKKMKAGKEHRVPLSNAALDVIEAARPYRGVTGLLFPSPRGRMLSDSTLSKLLRENGIAAVPHGFRSSFRDWCAETGVRRELAEAALAHEVGGVEGAYFRSDLFEQRRRVMDDWARFLDGEAGGKIIRFRR